jgi:cytochrome b subunit of formate dehydrogenase
MANKARINYWVDVGLVVAFVISFVTGIIKWPGLFRTLGLSYSGLPMLLISTLHDYSGLAMILLVLLHIILHFKWMISMTANLFRKKSDKKEVEDEN